MASSSDHIEEEIARIEEGLSKVDHHNYDRDDKGFCSASTISVVQKVVAEAIGTFFLVFAGCGSVAVNKKYGEITFPGVCIAWGLIVMVMVYSVGHISGAHFNPAVTIAFVVLRRFPLKHVATLIMLAVSSHQQLNASCHCIPHDEVPFYIIAQLLGAILASATLFLLLNPKPEHFFGTNPTGSAMQSFIMEIIISFLLMFVISGVSTDTRAIGELAGIAVGSTILLNVLIAGPISGGSMNPARSLGPAIVMHNYKAIWAYILGPIIGALAGGFTYNLIRFTDKPLREITKSGSFLNSISRRK